MTLAEIVMLLTIIGGATPLVSGMLQILRYYIKISKNLDKNSEICQSISDRLKEHHDEHKHIEDRLDIIEKNIILITSKITNF